MINQRVFELVKENEYIIPPSEVTKSVFAPFPIDGSYEGRFILKIPRNDYYYDSIVESGNVSTAYLNIFNNGKLHTYKMYDAKVISYQTIMCYNPDGELADYKYVNIVLMYTP